MKPGLHPLTLDRLERALAEPGCPVCWEAERNARTYLRGLLREHAASEGVWERLERNWGLCPRHTRGLLAEELRTLPGLCTATLYRWLAGALLKKAREGGVAEARVDRRSLRALLRAEGGCLACEQLDQYEEAVVAALVRALGAGGPAGVAEAYRRGAGLCLPHLRRALDLTADAATGELLARHFLEGLEALAHQLERFLADPSRDRGSGPAGRVWLRAVERFSGRLDDDLTTPGQGTTSTS